MGGTTNIIIDDNPWAIFMPVSPADIKAADMATPIKPLINKMMRNKKILMPVDCFKFSIKKLSCIVE